MQGSRDLFQIRKDVTFLNHGSYGACPKEVFAAYQDIQRELESQPLLFMRTLGPKLEIVRREIEQFVCAEKDSIALCPNVTTALNIVAHSLQSVLQPGDEILATSHEYGAMVRMWSVYGSHCTYKKATFSLPIRDEQQMVDEIAQSITPRTRVIFISHITSATALILPVAKICQLAREKNIFSVVDGAHAPGQVPIDICNSLKCDFYGANLHKWFLAPKGSAFLYCRPELQQPIIKPLVVSWGYNPEPTFHMGLTGSSYLDSLSWWGTVDPSPLLTVPMTLRWLRKFRWLSDDVAGECHRQCSVARQKWTALVEGVTEDDHIYLDDAKFFAQMVLLPLPRGCALSAGVVSTRLYDEHLVEIPGIEFEGRHFLRLSFQGYNTQQDVDRLIEAVKKVISTK